MEDINIYNKKKLTTIQIISGIFHFLGVESVLTIAAGCIFSFALGSTPAIYFSVLGGLLGGFTSTSPDALRLLVEDAALKGTYIAIGAFVGALLGKFLLGFASQRVSKRVKTMYFKRIMHQEIAFFDTHSSGNMIKTISEDVAKLTYVLEYDAFNIFSSLGQIVVCFIFAIATVWQVGLIGFTSVPIMIVLVIISSIIVHLLSKRASEQLVDSVSTVNEVLGSMRTVRSMAGEKKEIDRYNKNITASSTTGIMSAVANSTSSSLIVFCIWGSIAACFYYAGVLLQGGNISVTALVSMWGYVLIAVQSLQVILNYIPSLVKSYTSILALLEVPDIKPVKGLTIDDIKGHIVLENITFRYPTRPKVAVLKNFSLSIQPGKSVALVGQSGSGKSTIVGLLEKWYDYEEGSITIDGIDLRKIDTQWLHRHVGIVSQEPTLFANTISKNISYALDTMNFNTRKYLQENTKLTQEEIEQQLIPVSQETIEDAARKANAHDFIIKLPDGYNTILGERGVSLSGGQKQRIAIARSVLQNPSILLLDEATSALDTKSESLVQEALDKLMINRTSIVVAHRLTTVQNCDMIVVMKSGEVIEQGTHNELINKPNGFYNNLARKQMHEKTKKSSSDTDSITIDDEQSDAKSAESEIELKVELKQEPELVELQVEPVVNKQKKVYNKLKKNKPAKVDFSNVEEVKDIHEPKTRSFLPIFSLLGADIVMFPLFLLAAAAVGAVPITTIQIFSRIIKAVSPGRNSDGSIIPFPPSYNYSTLISSEALNLTFIAIAATIAQFFYQFLSSISSERFGVRIKRAMFSNAIQQEMGYFDIVKTGRLLSVFNEDIQNVRHGFSEKLANMTQYLSQFVIGLILSLVSSWKMSLVMLAASVGSSTLITLISQGAANHFNVKSNKFQKSAIVTASEVIGAIRTVRSMAGEDREVFRFEQDVNKVALNQYATGIIWSFAYGSIYFCIWAVNALGLYYGGHLAANGEISSSVLFTVTENMAIAVIGLSLAMIEVEHVFTAMSSSTNVLKIAKRKTQIPLFNGREIEGGVQGSVEIQNVSFEYPSRPNVLVMKDFSLSIQKGQHVALVGESGSGKSTITGLIERFYDPICGVVKIDGIDIKELKPEWLHKNISIVTQEPVLFATTIRKNITYAVGDENVTMEQIQQVAKAANAHDFIMSLPDNYDTVIGERGVSMSGGQKQRIAIARAMLQNSSILLLDEATSALDTEAEGLVQLALDRLMIDRTTIVIAHRLNTIKDCDLIVVMEHGRIVETGSHDDLLSKGGLYYKLSQKQMEFGENTVQ